MRGFLVGSLALIALYTVVQSGASSKVEAGSNVFASGVRRMLSGDVAGVPDRAKLVKKFRPIQPPAAAGGGGGFRFLGTP